MDWKEHRLTAMINHVFISFSGSEFKHKFAFFTFYGYITNPQCDPPPNGLVAQLVEHCTSIEEVMGSNPV